MRKCITILEGRATVAQNHNYGIDLFRFFLILWIVLFHFTSRYESIEGVSSDFPWKFGNGGYIGTTLFFVLSGYYMGHTLLSSRFESIADYIKYCVTRYLRFWPTYALAVVTIYIWLLFLPVPTREVSFFKFIINLFFIIHPGGYVDGAHWFLTTLLEVQFFTALLKFVPPKHRYVLIVVLFFAVSIWFYNSSNGIFIGSEMKVLFGIILYAAKYNHTRSKVVLCLLCTCLLLYFICSAIFLSALIIMLLILFVNIPIKGHISTIAEFLGEISFSWYLVHQNIGFSLLYHIAPDGRLNMMWILLPICFTLVLAIIIHKFGIILNNIIYKGILKLNFYKNGH